jgi:serine/threonine protein kinase
MELENSVFNKISINQEELITVYLMIQMEYCEGQTLKNFLERANRQIDRRTNFRFFNQMMTAVSHIHQKDIIHRDLKPANVFMDG